MKNLLLLFFLSQTLFVLGQITNKSFEANDKLLTKYVKESNIPGLAVAIYHKDKLVWSKEYGYSNLEYKIPTSDLSKFRVASVSKLFTGSAILKLHESKKLNLDDSISIYLDSIPISWNNITIRQLAQHTSGIGHYLDVKDALDVKYYETTSEAMKKFKDRPLKHEPGKGVYYSSYAYTILAAVIEKVTGKTYLQAMQDIIFRPLEMNHTQADDQKAIIHGRTGFYQSNDNSEVEHSPYINLSNRWAGSGYLSTAKDIAKFGAAHTNTSSFFNKTELELLTNPSKINDTLSTKEGLGWGQREGWENHLTYWGDGITPGTTCGLMVYPEQNLSIAMVSNLRKAPLGRGDFQVLATRLVAQIEGEKVKEISKKDFGKYQLNIDLGGNMYNGELVLDNVSEGQGYFEMHGRKKYKYMIGDAFWKTNELWIFAISAGQYPLQVGVIPIKFKKNKNNLGGIIYRYSAKIQGKKVN